VSTKPTPSFPFEYSEKISENFENVINILTKFQRDRCRTDIITYKGADKSLASPGRKQATATEEFEFHISYL
jgi:hypothetical protein